MARLRVKLGASRSNYQTIRDLGKEFEKIKSVEKKKKRKKEEKERIEKENNKIKYLIIFSNTLIGAYKARKKHPENFCGSRIVGQVDEAEYIAKERQRTLKLLENNDPIIVLEKFYEEIFGKYHKKTKKKIRLGLLDDEDIKEGGIYHDSKYFKDDNWRCRAGKRLEIRIKKNEEKITSNMTEGGKKKIFYGESNIMSNALDYEIEELRRNHNGL